MATTGTWGNASTGSGGRSLTTDQSFGFQFTAPEGGLITAVKFNVQGGVGPGDWNGRLYSNNAGVPGTQIGSSSDTLAISTTGDKTFVFSTPPTMSAGVLHWIVGVPAASLLTMDLDTCTNDAAYGSGRNVTITSIGPTDLPSTEDWRIEITYTPAGQAFVKRFGGVPFASPNRGVW